MPTIIHVDDDPTVLDLNSAILSDLQPGVRVVGASHAQAALDALRDADPPVLLILDYWMPDMTGIQLWHTCRDQSPATDLTLAVVTGSPDDGLEAEVRALGGTLVAKHMDLATYADHLATTVREWMATRATV